MTIAHFSDTHLGYRQFNRTNERGFNQREVDVMECFRRCLDDIAGHEPDLVIHSGDFFDRVRPSNYSIVLAYKALLKFQTKRNGKPFILVAGNHETPRTLDSGNILTLFEEIPGVMVFWSGDYTLARRELAELDLEVLGVPTALLESHTKPVFVPETQRKYRILVLHGLERSVIPNSGEFSIGDTHPDRWSYVALGDYHAHRAFGPNCCYPGSLDYTSNNYWEEVGQPKGWVWVDLDKGTMEFKLAHPRPAIDLPPIHAVELTGPQITEAVLAQADWSDDPLPMVRQRILGVRPESRGQIDFAAIRALDHRCLNFDLKLEIVRSQVLSSIEDPEQSGSSLDAEWVRHMKEATPPAGIDLERVVLIGERLLKEVHDETDLAPA